MDLQPFWALASFQFPDLFTNDRNPWTGDQLVARRIRKLLDYNFNILLESELPWQRSYRTQRTFFRKIAYSKCDVFLDTFQTDSKNRSANEGISCFFIEPKMS
jgi:hypothetical protein